MPGVVYPRARQGRLGVQDPHRTEQDEGKLACLISNETNHWRVTDGLPVSARLSEGPRPRGWARWKALEPADWMRARREARR